MGIDWNQVKLFAEIGSYVVTPSVVVFAAIKGWPLLRRRKDLVHDARIQKERALLAEEKCKLAEDRALLDRERRRLAEDRATMLESIVETLRISNEGWQQTIEQMGKQIAELNHKLDVFATYMRKLILWARDRRTTDPMPPIPPELEDAINEGLSASTSS